MPQINKIYDDTLERYLKGRFSNSFTNILDEETDNMLKIFDDEKKRLKTELDFLFSEKIDEDLHEVNANLMKTFLSIIDYYKYQRTFKLPRKSQPSSDYMRILPLSFYSTLSDMV